ncbi:MAG: hypothetical protein L3J67_03390 [Hyphomicrobiaceae bacterium]|nr:hypothetical protein [Hyphomicrobiaceae bacterium]
MQFLDRFSLGNFQIVKVSRSMRILSIIFISVSLIAITTNFYMADAVYAQATTLPFYILFFLMMYLVGIFMEYASLWCKRDYNFHCASVAVHCLALMLVTYEIGAFYSADKNVYSHPPSYSLTSALSHIVT